MKRIAAALALALLLAAPAAAQDAKPAPAAEEKPATLEEQYYRAFYLENGLRDFEKAEKAYAVLAKVTEGTGRKDLQVKCLVGRARCLRTMGKEEEAKAATEEAVRFAPEDAEVKALAAAANRGGSPSSIEDRVRELANLLMNSRAPHVIRELRLAGETAVPIVAECLRERNLEAVENAAHFLSHYLTPASRDALLSALKDPEVAYPVAVAEAVCRPAHPDSERYRSYRDEDLPLLERIAARPEAELRMKVLIRLHSDSGHPASIAPLVLRLARDPAASVRVATLQKEWSREIVAALEPAITKALAAEDSDERAAAIGAAGRDAGLLRKLQTEVRALLRDPSAKVRYTALETLEGRDGLTQEDLAALLEDPDGALVAAAAKRLAKAAPWGDVAAKAVRRAVQRALQGEIAAEGIASVAQLIDVTVQPGGFTPEEWVDVLGTTWAPGFPWGAQATLNLRQRLVGFFRYQRENSGYQPSMDAVVLRGVETIPSADGVVQWLELWSGRTQFAARAAWLRAAASPDPRVRRLAYYGVAGAFRGPGPGGPAVDEPIELPRAFSATFPHLSADLSSGDRALCEAALAIARRVPDPSLAGRLRSLHDRAPVAARAGYLEALVRSAGKEAMDVVRADLASDDPQLRLEALGRLVISLGVEDPAVLKEFLERGGTPGDVASLWFWWDPPPSRSLLAAFVEGLPGERVDEGLLGVFHLLPPEMRRKRLAELLGSTRGRVRALAAVKAGEWRMVEAIPQLSALLDDPDDGVRASAQGALEELRTYIDLKASAARIGKSGAADTFAQAEAMLKSELPLKRKGAVLALAALGDRAAIPILLKALDDPDPSVQEAAVGALERLGGKPPAEAKKGE